ncbi:hypothetical protein ARMGADRAFT_1017794 [Armillaria gallica]|uniref:Uncharacterized protein n=1 Tax=Armillaria gallica TaxID=47427 RepID=A0A2H3DE24_ARMGA|nr:hypothetical protein ARMGADRAFT_1017794 [Armillaria gallica]
MRSQGRKPRLIGPSESESRGTSVMLGTDLADQGGRSLILDLVTHLDRTHCPVPEKVAVGQKSFQRHRTLDYGHYFLWKEQIRASLHTSFSMRARGPELRVEKKPNAALGSAQPSLRGWGHHEFRTRQPSELVVYRENDPYQELARITCKR